MSRTDSVPNVGIQIGVMGCGTIGTGAGHHGQVFSPGDTLAPQRAQSQPVRVTRSGSPG
jgi:hypothetical protein